MAYFFAISLYILHLIVVINLSFDKVQKCSYNAGNEHHKALRDLYIVAVQRIFTMLFVEQTYHYVKAILTKSTTKIFSLHAVLLSYTRFDIKQN